jgi:hypothetical protein
VRWLSIWGDGQATFAPQRVDIFSRSLHCHQAGGDGLSPPNGINRGGLFSQLKGSLTKKRYRYCIVFLDHYSQLPFAHLQIDASATETILVKQAFKKFATKHSVFIQHYHCDNGQIADNNLKQSCEASHQRLNFCGMNPHFKNGIAKCAIWDLLESARKQLLHAHTCWQAAVHFAL